MSHAMNCGCAEHRGLPRAPLWDWQKTDLKWKVLTPLTGLSLAQTQSAVDLAFRKWSAVCLLNITPAGAGETADINITIGDVSQYGPFVWAVGQMPNNGNPVTMTVSSGITWDINSPQLAWILAHEGGHNLGMIHSGYQDAVMFGTFNYVTALKQVDDIDIIQQLYGARTPVPDPITWTKVADQGGSFTLTAPGTVRYGADTRWTQKDLAAGTYTCDVPLFGGDPAYGTLKTCQVSGVTPPVPPTPTTPTVAITTTGTVQITVNGNPVG